MRLIFLDKLSDSRVHFEVTGFINFTETYIEPHFDFEMLSLKPGKCIYKFL